MAAMVGASASVAERTSTVSATMAALFTEVERDGDALIEAGANQRNADSTLPNRRVSFPAIMASRMKEITKEAIGLPKYQRLALARLLLDLDQPAKAGDIEGAWDDEIRARVRAVDEGRAVGVPYENIKKEM